MSQLSNKPVFTEVESGRTYFRCDCGLSATFPFCDGSHAGTGKSPKVYKADKTGGVMMCACGKAPEALCNGSHSRS